ncbi:MAG: CDP-alcohol phosphatidyltransferase family protein [Proteobacteria bacterium]|nr:CDP-alcohol phosphatidyltransferase family protein [Pseudomonadota bacterium]MBI3495818.1 CDP-alcohol phosphatidyltransferase family protein [Pseudomonadota bacterium]
MSLPNLVTLVRLLCAPVGVYLMLSGSWTEAFWVFLAAALSDGIDGLLARWLQADTMLGRYLDPLADKTLLVSVYITLSQAGQLPLWLVVLVVSRDMLIMGGVLLLHMVGQPPRMAPLLVSKANTVAQIALAGIVLADLAFRFQLDGSILTGMIALVGVSTSVSAAAYLVTWGRQLLAIES